MGLLIISSSGDEENRINLGKLFHIFGPEHRIAWAHFSVDDDTPHDLGWLPQPGCVFSQRTA